MCVRAGAHNTQTHAHTRPQATIDAYERSRLNLAQSFFEHKRVTDAARIIQRRYREHRLRRLQRQQNEGYQVRDSLQIPLLTSTCAQCVCVCEGWRARRVGACRVPSQALAGQRSQLLLASHPPCHRPSRKQSTRWAAWPRSTQSWSGGDAPTWHSAGRWVGGRAGGQSPFSRRLVASCPPAMPPMAPIHPRMRTNPSTRTPNPARRRWWATRWMCCRMRWRASSQPSSSPLATSRPCTATRAR